jgi:hypothetical protein
MKRSVTRQTYVIWLFLSSAATGSRGAKGVMAKTHGKATAKRENQQQLDIMKWAEEGRSGNGGREEDKVVT